MSILADHEFLPVGKSKDLTGQKFGKLTAIGIIDKHPKMGSKWLCLCECGEYASPIANNLLTGHTTSCGCVGKIGVSDWRLRNVWGHMMRRCHDPQHKQYYQYGDRGISVCDEWHDYKVFEVWALNHPLYNDKLTIERVDVNMGYNPNNCTWIPRSEQNKNKVKTIRLSAWGEEKTLLDWMNDDRCTVAYDTILYRVKNGVAHDVAMTHKGRMKILKHN